MSIKVKAKAHPFKNECAEFYRDAAPLSEIFTSLNSPLDITHARFLIDDEMVSDVGRTPPDGSTVYINVVPEGGGDPKDTGKGMFWGGLGLTLLAIGAFFIPVVGAALGGALLGVGVSAMLGGAVLMNTEIPSPPARGTGSQMESIRGSKNQTRKLGHIPVLFGRHLVTPDVAALPYTEIDAEGQQWLVQMFCAGYNDMVIENKSFKVGDTALTDLSSTKNINAILEGTDARVKLEVIRDGAASALYPRICVEQQFNSILKHNDDDDVPTPRVHTTPDKTTRINVDILFPQGLIAYDDDNDKKSASVSVSIQHKPDGAPDSGYVSFPGWTPNISRKTVDMFRLQATVSGLAPGKHTVKIVRNTADSSDSKTIDTIYAGSIRSFADDRPVRQEAAKNLVVIALKIRASALASGVIDNFNFVAQSNIPDYVPPTDSWTAQLTKNPASMLLYALRGKINPDPVADSDIDWDSFREFWTFCDTKGYACNAVQGDRELFSVLCAKIAKTGRASVLRMNGKFSVIIDRERPAPVQLFSPRNTINYRQTIVKADVPDEIALQFIDETTGWASNERSVYHTSNGLPSGTEKTKQASSIWGITDPDTVFKFARYQYACITNRPILHALECDIEYLLCKKGDLIEYAGDTALAGIAYGKITALISNGGSITDIVCDTLFPQEPGESYGIRCRRADGTLLVLAVLNRQTNDSSLRLAAPQAAGVLAEGDLVVFGIPGKITRQLVIAEIAPANNFQATLSCVDYSPEIFGVDDPDYVVPPFDNKITTSGSIVDSGIVKPPADTVTRNEAIEISQNFGTPGPSGPPATIYQLIASVTEIKRYNDGILDPPEISCVQQSVTGNSPPVESSKTLKYSTKRGGAETLYTGPVTVGDWEFIEFLLHDEGGSLLDRETVLVLRDGPPATVYRLVPGAPMIIRDVSGLASPSEISCAQEVVIGNNPPEPSDKTIKYIVSNDQTEREYSGPVPVAWDWIEFRLYDNHALLDSERVFVLREGEPARTYELWPSSSVIRLYNGITEPFRISCLQMSVAGNGLPTLSDKTLKYATSLDENEQLYTGEITVNPLWLWIEFRLYEGDALLDKERVPMLADGSTRMSLDLVNQNLTVRADEDGNVLELPITTQAVLYKGNAPVSRADFMAKVAEQNIVRYPGSEGSIFDPMLGDFYPVKTSWWSLSENPLTKKDAIVHYPGSEGNLFDPMLGDFYPTREADQFIPLSQASVDQNGLVTVKRLDDDETVITVNVAYDGALYSTPLKLIKVQEAARPVVIDIENENTSIACDVYGDPYPGELPLHTKAILFRGTELVSPFWFLVSAAKGISIAQDGTITVARNAYLADVNNVVVKAAFRGKTYTRMFTLSKTRDGESPVYLGLLPDNEVIQCDYMGNPLRGLPFTAQAKLSKGTQEITAAMELAEAARVEIIYYPGNLFDPILGDFCPTLGYPVVWSLAGAPPGVTIDSHGLITVSGTAQLSDINEITVRAKYHGKTHEAILGIAKARGGAPGIVGKDGDAAIFPRYRGVTLIADTGNTGIITLSSGGRIYMNDLDWVLFMGTADWTKARLYKWHEAEKWWEMLDPAQNTLDYMGALNDITEGAPDGIFSVVFCRLLFAQQAAIATLESQLLQVQNAIFGGERFTKSGDSVVDNGADKTGFKLGADGKLIVSNGEFSGVVKAVDGEFQGSFIANMQMAGFGSSFLPMAGSIRAYITGGWINGSFYGTKSDNIKELTRLAQGRYFLNFGSDGTAMLLSFCSPIGYFTRSEKNATDAEGNFLYPGTWAGGWGMIIGVPFGGEQIGGDYGISLAFKANTVNDFDADPMRFVLIIVG